VKVEQNVNVRSPDITLDNWITLARRVNRIFSEDPAVPGIVITHGTNTLQETAYFLNLTVKHDRPVVVTGAMPGNCHQRGRSAQPAECSTDCGFT
jgi:L-asparaginase